MTMRKLLVATAALAVATNAFPASATAGQCPPDRVGVDVTKPNAAAAKGVSDTVLGSIELAREPARLEDRKLRLRKLVVQPDGVVPWHSHADRPAIIYIVEGTITEYASNCAVPIVHMAGQTAIETSSTSHWWKNTGRTPVVLLSADLLHDEKDTNM
jgi:quercetin dioxygenase-like cupin family protein